MGTASGGSWRPRAFWGRRKVSQFCFVVEQEQAGLLGICAFVAAPFGRVDFPELKLFGLKKKIYFLHFSIPHCYDYQSFIKLNAALFVSATYKNVSFLFDRYLLLVPIYLN